MRHVTGSVGSTQHHTLCLQRAGTAQLCPGADTCMWGPGECCVFKTVSATCKLLLFPWPTRALLTKEFVLNVTALFLSVAVSSAVLMLHEVMFVSSVCKNNVISPGVQNRPFLVLFLVFQIFFWSISTYNGNNSNLDLHLKESHARSVNLSCIFLLLNISQSTKREKREQHFSNTWALFSATWDCRTRHLPGIELRRSQFSSTLQSLFFFPLFMVETSIQVYKTYPAVH